MKAFALGLVGLLATLSANATSIRGHQTEVLTKVEINGEATPYVAVLEMDYINSRMEVRIVNDICGSLTAQPGQIRCMAVGATVDSFSAPIQNRGLSCGSAVYQGQEDLTPADGALTVIEVKDHSRRTCDDIVPGIIEVNAKVEAYRPRQVTTYFLTK